MSYVHIYRAIDNTVLVEVRETNGYLKHRDPNMTAHIVGRNIRQNLYGFTLPNIADILATVQKVTGGDTTFMTYEDLIRNYDDFRG